MLELEALTKAILAAVIEVHQELGPGFQEINYEEALCAEFELRGIRFRRQVAVPVFYKGKKLKMRHRVDLIVEDAVVLEVKAVEKVLLVHTCQLFSYLKATKKAVGFVLNFNVPLMKDGIHRRVCTEKSRRLYDV